MQNTWHVSRTVKMFQCLALSCVKQQATCFSIWLCWTSNSLLTNPQNLSLLVYGKSLLISKCFLVSRAKLQFTNQILSFKLYGTAQRQWKWIFRWLLFTFSHLCDTSWQLVFNDKFKMKHWNYGTIRLELKWTFVTVCSLNIQWKSILKITQFDILSYSVYS